MQDLLRSTAKEHIDFELLTNAIPEMEKVAEHVNKNVQQAKFHKKFVEITAKAKSLNQLNRMLIFETVTRCELKKKNITFFLFNDLLVHLTETKARNKSTLALPQHQVPLLPSFPSPPSSFPLSPSPFPLSLLPPPP